MLRPNLGFYLSSNLAFAFCLFGRRSSSIYHNHPLSRFWILRIFDAGPKGYDGLWNRETDPSERRNFHVYQLQFRTCFNRNIGVFR
ncbi:hypothetical protein L596_013454 [Steinernema carpocapsae]|uniref:Uncharacterized protein n=1 Tax=Steinernema carpocapsae TaxID=34508 RepID=A0A4U5P0C3_STECR|nr:hypothetical protein L596_013454 [Steinernema carpocapsae]